MMERGMHSVWGSLYPTRGAGRAAMPCHPQPAWHVPESGAGSVGVPVVRHPLPCAGVGDRKRWWGPALRLEEPCASQAVASVCPNQRRTRRSAAVPWLRSCPAEP